MLRTPGFARLMVKRESMTRGPQGVFNGLKPQWIYNMRSCYWHKGPWAIGRRLLEDVVVPLWIENLVTKQLHPWVIIFCFELSPRRRPVHHVVFLACGRLSQLPPSIQFAQIRQFWGQTFFYSLATVCYVLTKSFNFWKHRILIVIRICVLIAY